MLKKERWDIKGKRRSVLVDREKNGVIISWCVINRNEQTLRHRYRANKSFNVGEKRYRWTSIDPVTGRTRVTTEISRLSTGNSPRSRFQVSVSVMIGRRQVTARSDMRSPGSSYADAYDDALYSLKRRVWKDRTGAYDGFNEESATSMLSGKRLSARVITYHRR